MIHSVNLNATWDTVLLCGDVQSGEVNRASSAVSYPGGKGNNAARTVALLGGKAKLFAFCGEADKAAAMAFYDDSGVEAKLFPVKGRNRPCVILMDAARDQETVINTPSSIKVTPAQLKKLQEALLKAIKPGDLVTFSGSIPEGMRPDTYKSMIKAVQAKGAVAMLDAYGPALKLGVEAAPFLVKPNAQELGETFNWQVGSRQEVLEAAAKILKFGVRVVVVTLGARGALVRTRSEAYFVAPLPETRGWHSPVGCGDTFFGALALGLDKGKDIKVCLQMATAAAWANLRAPGAVFFDKRLAKAQIGQVRVSRIGL
jgi:1-phosphofructokinase family hexose kinase